VGTQKAGGKISSDNEYDAEKEESKNIAKIAQGLIHVMHFELIPVCRHIDSGSVKDGILPVQVRKYKKKIFPAQIIKHFFRSVMSF
jgi:hypothetical protein